MITNFKSEEVTHSEWDTVEQRFEAALTISKLEYEQLQAESALMWEMTNDYGKQRDDGTWEHPFFDVIKRLHPKQAQRVIDADLAAQQDEMLEARRQSRQKPKEQK